MSKVANVTQRPDECPGDFYERLCEAYRIYMPFDPEGPDNQRMVNTAFVSQSSPDIRKKLQKLEGFAGMNISQLIEIANKVYNNREEAAEREARKRMEKKAALLAAALGRPALPPKGPPSKERVGHLRVEADQCAYCKERGHWKRECPNRKKRQIQGAPQPETPAPTVLSLAGMDSD